MKKNPLRKTFKIKKKVPLYKRKGFWFFLLFLIITGGFLYLLLFFKYFWVSSVDVRGTQTINSANVAEVIGRGAENRFLFASRSIFAYSVTNGENELKKMYPAIEGVTITKKLPNALMVNIRERSAVALWFSGQRFYKIDKFGIIFEETSQEDRLLIKSSQDKKTVRIGDQAIKEEMVEVITKIERSVKRDSGLIAIEALIEEDKQITIKTADGWDIYFDPKSDIGWQLTKLKAVLEKQVPVDRRGDLEYIDVRFGNLAPYRYRQIGD